MNQCDCIYAQLFLYRNTGTYFRKPQSYIGRMECSCEHARNYMRIFGNNNREKIENKIEYEYCCEYAVLDTNNTYRLFEYKFTHDEKLDLSQVKDRIMNESEFISGQTKIAFVKVSFEEVRNRTTLL